MEGSHEAVEGDYSYLAIDRETLRFCLQDVKTSIRQLSPRAGCISSLGLHAVMDEAN